MMTLQRPRTFDNAAPVKKKKIRKAWMPHDIIRDASISWQLKYAIAFVAVTSNWTLNQGHLRIHCGISRDKFFQLRSQAIKKGWLHRTQSGRSRAKDSWQLPDGDGQPLERELVKDAVEAGVITSRQLVALLVVSSFSDDLPVHPMTVARQLGLTDRRAVLRDLRELVKAGFLFEIRDEQGRVRFVAGGSQNQHTKNSTPKTGHIRNNTDHVSTNHTSHSPYARETDGHSGPDTAAEPEPGEPYVDASGHWHNVTGPLAPVEYDGMSDEFRDAFDLINRHDDFDVTAEALWDFWHSYLSDGGQRIWEQPFFRAFAAHYRGEEWQRSRQFIGGGLFKLSLATVDWIRRTYPEYIHSDDHYFDFCAKRYGRRLARYARRGQADCVTDRLHIFIANHLDSR